MGPEKLAGRATEAGPGNGALPSPRASAREPARSRAEAGEAGRVHPQVPKRGSRPRVARRRCVRAGAGLGPGGLPGARPSERPQRRHWPFPGVARSRPAVRCFSGAGQQPRKSPRTRAVRPGVAPCHRRCRALEVELAFLSVTRAKECTVFPFGIFIFTR